MMWRRLHDADSDSENAHWQLRLSHGIRAYDSASAVVFERFLFCFSEWFYQSLLVLINVIYSLCKTFLIVNTY